MVNNKVEDVKRISIPRYFERCIIPEMPSYYSDYSVNFEAKPVVKCPIHGEDTPSFRYYEETNTFYCFGCRAGGDIISLHRAFMNVVNGEEPTFKDSVEYLYIKFISGVDIEINKGKKEEDKGELSEGKDVIRMNAYIKELEGMLSIEGSISDSSKVEIYKVIDEVSILVGINEIGAKEGMREIQRVVRSVIK